MPWSKFIELSQWITFAYHMRSFKREHFLDIFSRPYNLLSIEGFDGDYEEFSKIKAINSFLTVNTKYLIQIHMLFCILSSNQ